MAALEGIGGASTAPLTGVAVFTGVAVRFGMADGWAGVVGCFS